jgi:phosphatidylglycerophosphatase A
LRQRLVPLGARHFGTLFAWVTFGLFQPHFTDGQLLFLLAAAYLAGIWFIDVAGRALGDPDHGSIVWDEIVPFWLILLLTPDGWLWQTAAFVLFRYFDITKPQPARYFDEHVKNGFGVMADDLVAAGYTLLALALLKIALT